jgi:hypothetical protein
MRVTKPVVLGVATLLGLGLTTAVAADTHGAAVSALAHQSKALTGEARGDAISALAKTNGKAAAAAAVTALTTARDAHGDAVSTIASDQSAVAAHTTGAMKTNHGGAVSAAARKR